MSSSNMNNITKLILGLVIVVAIAGGYFFPKVKASFGSPAGSTFNLAKVAAVNITPTTAAASSSAILNTDSSDRGILDGYVYCTGNGSSTYPVTGGGLTSGAWNWIAATSSTVLTGKGTSSADLALNVLVGTTTANSYTATSTYTLPYTRVWASGSYLVFEASATNTSSACQAGVHYVAL